MNAREDTSTISLQHWRKGRSWENSQSFPAKQGFIEGASNKKKCSEPALLDISRNFFFGSS